MKTQITIGDKVLDIVCNLGTEEFYRHLTGTDYNLELLEIKRMNDEAVNIKEEIENIKKESNIDERYLKELESKVFTIYTQLTLNTRQLAKQLAYVMNQQALLDDDSNKLLLEISKKNYFTWLAQFEPKDFSGNQYNEIVGALKSTTNPSVYPKN